MRETKKKLKQLPDCGSSSQAEIRVDGPALSFAKPLIEAYVWHLEGLHLTKGEDVCLRWYEGVGVGAVGFPEAKDVSVCLREFTKLHRKPDADILQFAIEWGILGIWPVRQVAEEKDFLKYLPAMTPHSQRNEEYRTLAKSLNLKLRGSHKAFEPPPLERDYWVCETVGVWRRLSSHFWNILQCAAALYRGEEPEQVWWAGIIDRPIHFGNPCPTWWGGMSPNGQLFEHYAKPSRIGMGRRSSVVLTRQNWRVEQQWGELLCVLVRWINQTRVQLFPEHTNAGIAMRLSVNNWNWHEEWTPKMYERCARENFQESLFQNADTYQRGNHNLPMRSSVLLNILVTQLMASVASPVYRCDICGEPFSAERKPHRNRSVLCQNEDCKSEQGRKRAKKQADKKRLQTQ